MKTLKSLLMLCAGLSFCACNSDNEPQFPEGNGAVTVKIVNPATRALSSATTEGQVVNGTITLNLTHSGNGPNQIILYYKNNKYYTDESFTTPTGGMDIPTAVFYDVASPTLLTASMNSGGDPTSYYDDIRIDASSPINMQAAPENAPAYGSTSTFTTSGNVIENNNTDYVEYVATVPMSIPIARLEAQISVGTFSSAKFNTVQLAGAYLDNIKLTGSAVTATDFYLKGDPSTTKKATNAEDAYAKLSDNYFNEDGSLSASALSLYGGTPNATKLPSTNEYFAYNFYTGVTPHFKLCLKVDGKADAGGNQIPEIQYAIVKNYTESYVDENDGLTKTREVVFAPGYIYRITNLTLTENDIQVDENGSQLAFALTATVTKAAWGVKTINGSWATPAQ